MKAIILAAWEGTRLRPITNTTPKPLIKIIWKTIIEHNLESIYNYVDEIIIVVKYLKEKFPETLGDNYKWTKITYHIQNDEKWTAAALKWINIDWDFILLNWDSIFNKWDLEKILKLKWYWALVQKTNTPEKYWIFKENNQKAVKIIEKPQKFVWDLANLW
jgi:bifunctional UDP-N-acetylglucosamine pyrophosphorylase/glucosamine-1-phosphate N-acetyltransferase